MIDRILVVCVGNICRSPVAEALLKRHLRESSKVVESAGISALVDRPADESSRRLAAGLGLDISDHRARQLTRDMMGMADLILVMELWHIESITRIAPEVRGKTKLLGYWLDGQEIPDPYQRSFEEFEKAVELIDQGVGRWTKYL